MKDVKNLPEWEKLEKVKLTILKGTCQNRKKEKVDAIRLKNLYVHEMDRRFNISHKSGFAVMTAYKDLKAALLAIVLFYHTLQDLDDPFEKDDPQKDPVAKKAHKFFIRHKRVWNNIDLENAVGPFYEDRFECEKIRMAINPKGSKDILDDYCLMSEKAVTHEIMNNI
jgi:hypothetical protein